MREYNSSKNLIIKILSEDQSVFKGCLPQRSKSYETYYDSNVPFIVPKNTAKCHKKKDTSQFLPSNRFSTLDLNDDVMIMEINTHDKDPANCDTKENTDKRQNSINMTNRNRKSNIRPSIC